LHGPMTRRENFGDNLEYSPRQLSETEHERINVTLS
jgi:hypothetical protein